VFNSNILRVCRVQQISYGLLDKEYFQSESEWAEIYSEATPPFDYIVIGSGFCSLAVIQRILAKRPKSRILIIEGGRFVLAEHFQNMPQVYQSTLGDMSKSYRWTRTSSEKGGPRRLSNCASMVRF